ncbi:ATP synthase [Steroidobacter denitrificans]|uniref:ATP synthase n=1 Tax=Steroidobacter denitrificans TaxID=465721 RepID=A0A127FCE3_STEDE|nr:ATP-binding protein [Steroidobacter denitrificans]AMN48077.1 ATP synthase [Steroidobacter denitrificans]
MSTSPALASGSYVLTHLDVYDWGAFDGRHSAQIDLAGTAIIGPTGSGKTTLVDALMTLLVASPRYNLASTGGHESDRDLVSYVRGVSGAGNDSEANEHIARPGPVVTAIAARFSNGEAVLRIGGVFWLDGTSSALTDLKRRWLFCQGDTPSLDEWLETHRDGGARALKELERTCPGFKVYDTKQAFLARLRNHFEVGENAFALLNRAAGLKQLNSIDTVFRELVLDDRSAFDSARAVADEFDTLAGIRQELETARRQRDTLAPIDKGWADHQETSVRLDEHNRLLALLPAWFGEQAITLWERRAAAENIKLLEQQQQAEALSKDLALAEAEDQALQVIYLQAGGQRIEELRRHIDTQEEKLERCQRQAKDYQAWTISLGLSPALTLAAVQANQTEIEQRRIDETERWEVQKRAAWEIGAKQQALLAERDRLKHELDESKQRPGSNIPVEQQRFRSLLADHLSLDESALPFVAELVEVQPEQARWRGAIERAIGSERLRLLIAPEHAPAALTWINARDNRLHVRLREADAPAEQARFFDDGFTRKLNFKPHAHRQALKHLLASIDRHCVDDVQALRRTPYAMTVQGLMSGRSGYFDKQDQKPLGRDWMTGFDNRDQLARLAQDLATATELHAVSQSEMRKAEELVENTRKGLSLLDRIKDAVFNDIDVPGAQAELDQLRQQLQALTAPASDVEQARIKWEIAKAGTEALRGKQIELQTQIRLLTQAIEQANDAVGRIRKRIGSGLDEAQRALATQHLETQRVDEPSELDDLERREREGIQRAIERQSARLRNVEQQLVRDMAKAKAADTGALSEVGTELQDVPAYRERLRVLDEEALPEKLGRFLTYLNQSSDQGVTQLLSEIDSEVSVIEERIADLNATLERVDFQPDRYLRLEPQRVEHESLRTLRQARAHLRSAQLKDDQGESHYRALADLVGLLRDAVERRKTLGALALLDPRYRLQFAVLVIERGSGKIIEKRTSSQGGSGGEKEIIASYVLTASLSYALCPPGSQRPLFGTIVLDEAFSKSSQAVAGRIIRALAEFGLHPLFVTPNKELRLLREHTRSAIVVHRKGAQATMTSLSWEALEAHARNRTQRQEHDVEVA